MKKLISVLLVLAMLASLFAGLTLTTNAASYAYNNGKRGEVCTSLSSAALSYWSGSYDYATLSAKTGDTLRTTLRTKITSNRSTVGYDNLQNYFIYTDAYQGSSSQVMLFYAGIPTSSTWAGTTNWNREHMWPDSLGGNAMEGDLHSMRPTDPKANSTRSNNKYGNAGSGAKECYTFDNSYHSATLAGHYSSGIFEPLDNAKGDCARVILYDYVVATSMSSPTVTITDIQTLLDWCALDPVDTYEMQRNDIVQTIEGCRNPFVDYPELAWKLFSSYTMPANMPTPSGNTVSYTVNATSNNTNYGTVSVNGCVITASPKTGYYAQGYTVTSGTATVTQNGNTFTVNAESDCTVRINFAAKTAATVSFSVPVGVTCTPVSGYAGEAIKLPTPNGTPTGDYTYTFKGWVRSAVDNQTGKPAEILSAGADFTPTGNTTLYALYSYSVGGTGGSSTTFTKITEQSVLTDGASYVFTSTVTNKALSQNVASDWAKAGGTYTGSSIESPAATDVWTVSGGVISCSKGNLSSSGEKKIALGTSTTNWTFTVSGGAWTIASGNNVMSYNSSGWRPYKNGYGSDKTFYIYKAGAGGGTTYYTTVIGEPCDHTFTSVVTAPTCTAEGYTTHTCSACGYSYTDTQTPALGHAYGTAVSNGNGTHTKTCSRCTDKVTENCDYNITVAGNVTTYTCKICGAVYTSEATVYTVTYNVLGTVTGSDTCEEGKTVTLPAMATAVDGYKFKGWVASAIGTETTTAPTVLTGSYKPTDNISLYAVYTRTEAGQGGSSDTYALTDDLTNGDYMFGATYSGGVVVPNTTVTSGWLKYKSFTPSNGVITNTDALYVWTLTNQTGGGFTLKNKSTGSYLYIKSSTGSGTAATDSSAHTVYATVAVEGDKSFELHDSATATTSTGNQLCFNYNGGSGGYRNYANRATDANMPNQFTFYKAGAGMITYYTTQPTGITPCAHPETTLTGYVAPSCTTAGYTGDLVCGDCGEIVEAGSVIPATGHSYNTSGICTVCSDKLIGIDSAALKLDEDIDVIYNATVPEGATASMTFTMNGETTTVNDDGSHSFLFEGVNPQCMGDNISATLSVTYGGKNYSCTKANYSVKTYCTDLLAKSSTTATLRKLLSDTLAYGAAAQTYMDYKTNALVTSGVTGTSYSTFTGLSGLAPTFTGTAAESPVWTGAYVTLSDDVAMVFRFASPNKTGLSVKVTYNGKTTTFSGTSITAVSGMSGVYEVKLEGIKATDFGQTVTAKFDKSGAQVGETIYYSVNAYICAKQNDADIALQTLVRALYNYGQSAISYVG